MTLTSVGAGSLGAVLLRALYPLRMQAQKMIATDTIHAIPLSLLGGLSDLLLGLSDLKILELLLIGSIPAALIGSFLITGLPDYRITGLPDYRITGLPIKITRNSLAATLILASIKLFNG